MRIIEKICDMIEKELDCAECYAKCALEYKESYQALADAFYKIANEKMGHMNLLHGQVVSIIEDYKKKKGEPPEAMKTLYEILHRKQIAHAASVKGMLALYKGE